MPYEDFTGVPWKVDSAEVTSDCVAEDPVDIEGPEKQVMILCRKKAHYGLGEYIEESNSIEGPNYEITLVEGQPRRIKFCFKAGIGGSWTAEDSSGDPGGA
ncbi:MAG TPA: hypothetical protein VH988_28455 [Thermoanaerobaculia bacterium]|nr:hypothetical protein [Thermoanaerobaculia bacterium]